MATTHLIGFEILRHRHQHRRFLSLMLAAAACARCAPGGGSEVRPAIGVPESLCSEEAHQLAAPDDSGGRSKPASRH